MSTDHHTPIALGAAANAATFNSVFEQLDAAITAGIGGVTLTNRSGGSLAANDCVVVDTANDEAVTTTTTSGNTTRPGIVVAGGANGAEVTVSLLGEVTVVVDGAGTRGQWIKTSSTAKRVTPTSTLDVGVFGILTHNSSGGAGTTATALLLGVIVTQPGSHTHAASEIVSGLLALARGGTGADLSATGPGFLKQASGGAVVTVTALAAGDMPSGIDAAKIGGGAVSNTEFGYLDGVTGALQTQLDGKASTSHKNSHKTGGSDAFVAADLLDAVARVQVKKSGTTSGTRRGINLIPGNNVSITLTDQNGDEHVDVEISAAGGGLGTDELTKVGSGGTPDYLSSADFQQDSSNHITLRRDVFGIVESATFKNILINGNFNVWQRGSGATSSPAGSQTYLVDRFFVRPSGAAVTQERSTTVPGANNASRYSLKINGAASVTTVDVGQRIEQQEAITRCRQTLTFSCYVYNNSGASFTPKLRVGTPTAADDFTTVNNRLDQSLQDCPDGLWTRVSASFDPTGYADVSNGLEVALQIPSGSLVAGDVVQVAQAQLEPGGVATAFAGRPVGLELGLCLRYFEEVGGDYDYQYFSPCYVQSSTAVHADLEYSKKRTVPSISISSASHFQAATVAGLYTPSAITGDVPSRGHARINLTISGGSSGSPGSLRANGTTNARIYISAEL